MKLNRKTVFPWVILISGLIVSASAAFYSVTGLSKLFAGAGTQVLILTGSLELAKLILVSALKEYWEKIRLGLRI